jgi:alkylhydroperoxidase/carboxymuconolactone decarboxylase family protein YurZ
MGSQGSENRSHEAILVRLAMNDDAFVESMRGPHAADIETSSLDPRTHALVRLAAELAMDASAPTYSSTVAAAAACGATPDEIVGVLVAVGPEIGAARMVSAAPALALALGFDVDDALEREE